MGAGSRVQSCLIGWEGYRKEMVWEPSLGRKVSSWLFARGTWTKGILRRGPSTGREHICRAMGGHCGDWKEETEKWGQGAILEVLEPSFSVSNGD